MSTEVGRRTTASARTDAQRSWDRNRVRRTAAYLGVVGVGLVLIMVLALSAQRPDQPLDPQSPGPEGGMALAEVLRQQGVQVDVVRSIGALEAADPDGSTTVLVGDRGNLGPGATERLGATTSDASRLVLVGFGSEQLRLLALPVESYPADSQELVARCRSTVARTSDVVTALDTRYAVTAAAGTVATTCFALPDPDAEGDEPAPGAVLGAAMVELPGSPERPEVVVVGLTPAWSNGLVAQASHAGVGLRALGSQPRLVWYQPGTGDLTAPGVDGAREGVEPLWPVWTVPVVALVGVAVVLLALSRGRRLGRLVREPLPVVVRAIETTESRGRLYRRAGDHQRAADVLRAGTRERLARRLALPPSTSTASLVHAASTASGIPSSQLADILSGAPPGDDASLIRLARQLTDLEERVSHP
jgi:hypothetical protein